MGKAFNIAANFVYKALQWRGFEYDPVKRYWRKNTVPITFSYDA